MKLLVRLLCLPFLWCGYLIARLLPREESLIVFGTHTNFSGNVKALFLEKSKEFSKVFVSRDSNTVEQLRAQGLSAVYLYSLDGLSTALRASVYVYSSYPSDISFWLSNGATMVNVWHGTPLKRIERDIENGPYKYRQKYRYILQVIAPELMTRPHRMLASSKHEMQCFATAFDLKSNDFIPAFPPRLTKLYATPPGKTGQIVILFTPTWRDDHSYSVDEHLDYEKLSSFCEKHNIHFKIKQHPSDKTDITLPNYPNVSLFDRSEDVYELLGDAHILVTDYSSMLFEALYIGRKVVIFSPDYDEYLENCRSFYFEPDRALSLVPCRSQAQLMGSIASLIEQLGVDFELPDVMKPFPVDEQLLGRLCKDRSLKRQHQSGISN